MQRPISKRSRRPLSFREARSRAANTRTCAHSDRELRLLARRRDVRLRETQRQSPVHHAITSADHRDTDARVPVFQKPDDGVPDDDDDQAAEAGLDEDDDI